jgi:protein-S-isoprenylcysteine O-methyltransferase Ste14
VTQPIIYATAVFSVLVAGFLVFRVMARADYRRLGCLSPTCSLLELIVWLGYMALPWIFAPLCWPIPWACPARTPVGVALGALVLISIGALVGFGSMAWLGIGRSFGRPEAALHATGPYRWSRNPQLVGGSAMVIGMALRWPSGFAVGWVVVWAALGAWMVLTEEEHLRRTLGEAYDLYCARVPRFLGWKRPS